jgi:hypothetical protein
LPEKLCCQLWRSKKFSCHFWSPQLVTEFFKQYPKNLGSDKFSSIVVLMATFDRMTKTISGRSQKNSFCPICFGVDQKKLVANCGDRKWVTKRFWLPIVATSF